MKMQIFENEALSRHTYYRIGGPARYLAMPTSWSDLVLLSDQIRKLGLPWMVMGAGTNLLVSDEGFNGFVIKCSQLDTRVELIEDGILSIGASVPVSSLLRNCASKGWGGLEFLAGIPGQMGGVVAMNGGTHIGEIKDRLLAVSVFSFDSSDPLLEFTRDQIKMSYRANHFLPKGSVIYSLQLTMRPTDPQTVKSQIDSILKRRKETQPLEAPSCGSVFKNPKDQGLQAWQVIDQLGLRGHRIGNAQISTKHSNWILNLGQAKAKDVSDLIELVELRAKRELGIEMKPEVIRIGRF
jgi:UDP-N-acetylmuramate dehydrogenase